MPGHLDYDVVGVGLNAQELKANKLLSKYHVQDLNKNPDLTKCLKDANFDVCICVVSIDYLCDPLNVLKSVFRVLKNEGKVILVLSNRMFPSKAVNVWKRSCESERVQICATFLKFAGFSNLKASLITRKKWTEPSEEHMLWVVSGDKK